MRIGTNMQNALRFGNNYPGWHGYSKTCNTTLIALARLARLGLVEISRTCQFRVVATPLDIYSLYK